MSVQAANGAVLPGMVLVGLYAFYILMCAFFFPHTTPAVPREELAALGGGVLPVPAYDAGGADLDGDADAMDLAVEAALFLEFEGIQIAVEPSPINLRGLSHREWGDATSTKAILIESANPAQGRLRGPTNEALIMEGRDRYYDRAGEMGLLHVPFGKEGPPLAERVGRHIQTVSMLLEVFSTYNPDRAISVENLPTLQEVMKRGLGACLAPLGG